MRLALGASGWRLAQQLLTESLVLAGAGAALGLLFTHWASPLIVAQLSTQTNFVFLDLHPDWRVFAFTTTVTALTAVVFGTVPALRASRVAPAASMKESGRTFNGERQGMASGLIVAQVALSLMLVVVAGLFVRTFMSLVARPLGLEPDRVLLVDISAPRSRFGPMKLTPVFERARAAVSALPGVTHAALSRNPPITGGQVWSMHVKVEGAPTMPESQRRLYANAVTPQWFATVGTPLLAGRDFNDTDRTGAPVAIVNRTFARQFGLGENPIGRVILRREPGSTREVPVPIVGLAADAVYSVPRDPIPPTMYVPLTQEDEPRSSIVLSVRAAGSPASIAKSVGAAIVAVHPDLVLTFRPLKDQVSATLVQERLLAMLSGFFGALALLLAGLGLYGITAYTISRRRSEIGIRMALGATPAGVIGFVLTRLIVLLALGLIVGGTASAWASRFVASLLYGVEPHDLGTLLSASAVLAAVAALAGWLPARRAARIDPAVVLRES